MVPNRKEPLLSLFSFLDTEIVIIFAALIFETTSKLMLQAFGGNKKPEAMETSQRQSTEETMTEKDRWMLAAAICSAIGTAITTYFASRK